MSKDPEILTDLQAQILMAYLYNHRFYFSYLKISHTYDLIDVRTVRAMQSEHLDFLKKNSIEYSADEDEGKLQFRVRKTNG